MERVQAKGLQRVTLEPFVERGEGGIPVLFAGGANATPQARPSGRRLQEIVGCFFLACLAIQPLTGR